MRLLSIVYAPVYVAEAIADRVEAARYRREFNARGHFAYEAHLAAAEMAEYLRVEILYADEDDLLGLADLGQALEACGFVMARTHEEAFGDEPCGCPVLPSAESHASLTQRGSAA